MFQMNHISAVYSGRKGCACGCRGKYSYASAHAAEARPSYMTGQDGISDRAVVAMATKVEGFIRSGAAAHVMVHDDFIAVDMPHDRTYTIYFRKGSQP